VSAENAGNRLLAGIRGKTAPDVTKRQAPVKPLAKVREAPLSAPAPAPHNGTETSREAAESLSGVTLAKLEQKVYGIIKLAGARGMTCDEIEDVSRLTHQTCSARVNGLMQKGAIEELLLLVPEKGSDYLVAVTRKTRSGRAAQVWIVVPKDAKP
jgi:hypothetical protein